MCDNFVNFSIASAPDWYQAWDQDFPPANILASESDSQWVGRDMDSYSFVLELEDAESVTGLRWRDRGDRQRPAKMTLQVLDVGESWLTVSEWANGATRSWQNHMFQAAEGKKWRLTFFPGECEWKTCIVYAVQMVRGTSKKALKRKYFEHLGQNMIKDQTYTDITLICGTERFPSHCVMLAAASTVLRSMLDGKMSESRTREIHIVDAEPGVVKAALEYIYTGSLVEHVGFGLCALGHKYDIMGLVECAAPLALRNITVENVLSELRLLRVYADDPELGPFLTSLEEKIRKSPELFRAVSRHC